MTSTGCEKFQRFKLNILQTGAQNQNTGRTQNKQQNKHFKAQMEEKKYKENKEIQEMKLKRNLPKETSEMNSQKIHTDRFAGEKKPTKQHIENNR